MTRSWQQLRGEITEEALRQAAQTKRDVCAVLKEMLAAAKKAAIARGNGK